MGRFHLHGWQRIGIVLSILWAIVSCLYIRYSQLENAEELSAAVYNRCKDAPENLVPIPECIADTGAMYREFEGSWGSAALGALIPIPIVWLLAYLFVVTVRWIRRGFSPS
jgi:hypothetical protein